MSKPKLLVALALLIPLTFVNTKKTNASEYIRGPFTLNTDCLGYKFTETNPLITPKYTLIYGGPVGSYNLWGTYGTPQIGYLRVLFATNGRMWTMYKAYKDASCL
jgi:hypothetical protein